jgi:hypothetical protein
MLTLALQCDESKPRCSNCKRRHVRCDFDPARPITPPEGDEIIADREDLHISEIELTYHWTISTCRSLSAWTSGATRWQTLLEDVALQHQYVLELMFALTALHLAYCRPTRREEYIGVADRHYERALARVTPELANISSNNCDAILLSVQLICFVNWARGPRPGEYLAFGDHGRSEWLIMFKGIRTTLDSFGRDEFLKTHTPAIRSRNRPLTTLSEPLDYQKQLSELRNHVIFITSSAEAVQAVDILAECYSSRYAGCDSEYHVVFAWLYRLPDTFLDQLQQRDAIPLIVYAHFVVLMHEMERFWYTQGWTHHIMRGIFEALPAEHNVWIRWPMAQIGWIAS